MVLIEVNFNEKIIEVGVIKHTFNINQNLNITLCGHRTTAIKLWNILHNI